MSETFVSEYTRIKNNISAAYAAAEEKTATIPDIKNSENLISTIDTIPIGSNINGIIAKYPVQSGATVNAGDFVEYINEYGKTNESQQIHNSVCNDGGLRAIQLDDSTIVIAHGKSNINIFKPLCIAIYKIGLGYIAKEQEIIVDTARGAGQEVSLLKIDSTSFVIFHSNSFEGDRHLTTLYATYTNSTITVKYNTENSNDTLTFSAYALSFSNPILINESLKRFFVPLYYYKTDSKQQTLGRNNLSNWRY